MSDADPVVWHEFFLYDGDDTDYDGRGTEGATGPPRFSFWIQTSNGLGAALFDVSPDSGVWLDPEQGSDFESVEPTDELRRILGRFADGKDVDSARVAALSDHEHYFVQAVHGTATETPDALPDGVWDYMHHCKEVVDSE